MILASIGLGSSLILASIGLGSSLILARTGNERDHGQDEAREQFDLWVGRDGSLILGGMRMG